MDERSAMSVYRPTAYYGYLSRLSVRLDGARVARIRTGETIEVPVEPGLHRLSVKMEWARSPDLTIEVHDSETVKVEVVMPRGAAGIISATLQPREAFSLRLAESA